MKGFSAVIGSIVLMFCGCSLSIDLSRMDDEDDFESYALKWAPSEDAFVAVQRLAKADIDAKDWERAAKVFERFKPMFTSMQARFDIIIGLLRARSQDLQVENLGSAINTPANEIKPCLTADGSRLYFASDRPGGKGELDIYVSTNEDGTWSQAVNLGDRINTPEHETINGLSFDGTEILLYGGFPGHMGNGDNYYFEKTEKGWSSIRHFPPPVNSNSWDSDAFITADGQAVLFTSDREGVQGKRVPKGKEFHGSAAGNSDIWVSVRRGSIWMPPINLGPVINTPYAERSPFLHPDGKTLYFSSDGHPGMGKLDVFKSVRSREDNWTDWSEPVNLGKEINTSDDDWAYKITTDGRYAAFSASNRPGGLGQNDVYLISLPTAARPESEVATITGTVLDENGRPLGARIKAEDLETGQILAELRSDPQTGEILFTLPKGKNYGIYLERDGYYPDSKNLDLRNGSGSDDGSGKDGSGKDGSGKDGSGKDGSGKDGSGKDGTGKDGTGKDGTGKDGSGQGSKDHFTLNFNLKSLEDMLSKRDKYGELLAQRVNNIFFDFNKFDLKPESFPELRRLVSFIQTNAGIRIRIEAHTDDIGSDEFNNQLSRKRAKAVTDYLEANGVPSARLVPIGYGESRPEVPNDTEENRARNRRVEFRIAE